MNRYWSIHFIVIWWMLLLPNSWSWSQLADVFHLDSLNRYENVERIGVIESSTAEKFPFVYFGRNHYQFFTVESPSFEGLYYKICQMIKYKDRKLNFYHIGGSHIQADIYSNYMREQLQTGWKGLPGERGWVFPFNLAGTNNPSNYRFTSPNKWEGYRSVISHQKLIQYGLMGMAISSTEAKSEISFKYRNTISKPPIDHVRIYHNKGTLPYQIDFSGEGVKVVRQFTNDSLGFTETYFANEISSFTVRFERISSNKFTSENDSTTQNMGISLDTLFIYGFQLMNNRPGISYTSIGVNGAGLYTYMDNVNFEEQLKELPPDFIAFSVGTNDANTTYEHFNPNWYKHNLEVMMKKVWNANPDCAILLTVPNDAFYMRKYPNRNEARERKVIIELAEEYQLPVWDLYGLMGELGSSRTWYLNGLMRSDYIHFTGEGYIFKGKLFYASFLKWMEQMKVFQHQLLTRF